jgi:hypothetical protein
LRGTISLGLRLSKSSSTVVSAYSDAKSTDGFVVYVESHLVS